MNPYKILGVEETASNDEIKKAYKKLCQKYHPDKEGGDEQKFKEINNAYEELTNPKYYWKKRSYSNEKEYTWKWDIRDDMSNEDMEEYVNEYWDRIKNKYHDGPWNGPFGGFDFKDSKKEDGFDPFITYNISLKLKEAYNGTVQKIIRGNDIIWLDIPPKIPDGSLIKHKYEFKPGYYKNILFKVTILPDEQYELEGSNLKMKCSTPFIDFYKGTTLPIPTLDGSTLMVKLPPGSKNGITLKVKGKGYGGDLYVTVESELPKIEDDKLEKIIEILSS